MEEPSSITPLVSEKQKRMRELSRAVTDLGHELQEINRQREEYIQHMRGGTMLYTDMYVQVLRVSITL